MAGEIVPLLRKHQLKLQAGCRFEHIRELVSFVAVLHGQPMSSTSGSAGKPAREEGPTWHVHDILDQTSQDNARVGRNEVHMALTAILQKHSPQESPFAVDITATSVFPWHRWLRNVVQNREIIGSGIVKVFALCQTSISEARIVFCHPDDTYTCAKPANKLEYEHHNGWTSCSVFAQASVEIASWMQIRAHLQS